MTELVTKTRLTTLARDLRTGVLDPATHLDRVRNRFERVEPAIEAFVPENGDRARDGSENGNEDENQNRSRYQNENEDRWTRLARSRKALERRTPSDDRPTLYGVPVGVKDVFHVDGFETRAGSTVPPTDLIGSEAPTVSTLRDAGALVLGKTVTAEFAYFAPGPTRNPHNTDHTPGGSSSGSATAVAAGVCPLALGTQTVGSVNRPAAFCGVVGVAPSYDRLPTEGVVPVAPSVDHVGFFAADVASARLGASILYPDWHPDPKGGPDTPTALAVNGPFLTEANPVGRDHFDRHLTRLTRSGLDIHRVEVVPDFESVATRHDRLVAAEMALSHADLYPAYGDRYAKATREQITRGRAITVDDLCAARTSRTTLRQAIHDRLDDFDAEVVLSPAAPGPAPTGIDDTGDPVMNLPWTHAGLPTVTLPASTTETGLPMGIQCTGRYGADERLLGTCAGIATRLN
jgi:Asp-tRNA(Asn)/Glu-tRNA(Gln) amidotransferase A subunit family amidase